MGGGDRDHGVWPRKHNESARVWQPDTLTSHVNIWDSNTIVWESNIHPVQFASRDILGMSVAPSQGLPRYLRSLHALDTNHPRGPLRCRGRVLRRGRFH